MNNVTLDSISLYGCGVVSPAGTLAGSDRSQALEHFLNTIWQGRSVLQPSTSFHGNTLVGNAIFDFENYRKFITHKVNEKRFVQLQKSAGECVQFAMGAFIDALHSSGSSALEELMSARKHRVSCIVGTGLADLNSIIAANAQLSTAQFEWDAFWGKELALAAIRDGKLETGFVNPDTCDSEQRRYLEAARLYAHYAKLNPKLHDFLSEYERVEMVALRQGELSLINQMKAKGTERLQVRKKHGAPLPPWESVSANVLWNIPNLPAAQISMLLGSHGFTVGFSGACSSFATALRMGLDEILLDRADVAIVGATDVNPRPEIIAAFHGARIGAYGGKTVFPMTELRGTHLSGGACIWILCRDDLAQAAGLRSLGVKIRGVGVTSDGEHVITPSAEGPSDAVRTAFRQAQFEPAEVQVWDLHSTGTPGDTQELDHVKAFAGPNAVLTARKGLFGHGMAASGGWELSAQLLAPQPIFAGATAGGKPVGFRIPPTGIPAEHLSEAVLEKGLSIVCEESVEVAVSEGGSLRTAKLNMGVGGISSCVICERTAK